jgi:hypothetical protein
LATSRALDTSWTNLDHARTPFDSADELGRHRVCLLGALGVAPQHHGRIMTAARGDGGRRHPPVKQVRFMGAAQILELEIGEAERAALRTNSFVVLRGLRSRVNEKPSPDYGGFGNISASAGSFTSDRSTGAPSGMPATIRKCRSRSATRRANRSSSIVIVRLWISFFGPLSRSKYLLVCSIARSIERLSRNVDIFAPKRQDFAAPGASEG